jgi:NADPH:quinone reductase-like Zn-dependent oxidoreductase
VYRLPLILGNDLAGTVIRAGVKVRGFKPGDEVYARPDKDRIGTFAERIAVAEADLALNPASISMEEAGSLPLVASAAWQALVERGNLQPGQKVLIHAGGKAIGIAGPPDANFARESRLNPCCAWRSPGLAARFVRRRASSA